MLNFFKKLLDNNPYIWYYNFIESIEGKNKKKEIKNMKKILILLLALAMTLTMFASCSSCKEGSKTPDNGTTDGGSTNLPDKNGFVTVDKTYYVNADGGLNVRKSPDAEADKLGSLPFGTEVKVIGENESLGWFRIDFNGEVAYVNATYLATEKPEPAVPDNAEVIAEDQFQTVNETVYIYATNVVNKVDKHQCDVEKVNAYSRAYKENWEGKSDSWIANHAAVTRVGVYYSNPDDKSYGWSKLSVVMEEGKEPVIIYVRNSQIIATLPNTCTTTPADTSAQ